LCHAIAAVIPGADNVSSAWQKGYPDHPVITYLGCERGVMNIHPSVFRDDLSCTLDAKNFVKHFTQLAKMKPLVPEYPFAVGNR
jgi:hypothetical protein